MKPWADAAAAGMRLLAGGALALGLVAASRVDVGRDPDAAFLRLDLRLDRSSVEVCRDRTAEELDALPVHMRQPRICDRHPVAWDLRVALDDVAIVEERLAPAGARSDRPVTFDRQVRLEPRSGVLRAELAPRSPADATPAVAAAVAELPRHRLETRVELAPGRVALLTRDPATDALRVIE